VRKKKEEKKKKEKEAIAIKSHFFDCSIHKQEPHNK